MIKSSIEKLANGIGFDIANSDDQVQSDLLNGFFEGLSCSMQKRQLDMQLCYVADKLSNKTCDTIKSLVEFIDLKNKE